MAKFQLKQQADISSTGHFLDLMRNGHKPKFVNVSMASYVSARLFPFAAQIHKKLKPVNKKHYEKLLREDSTPEYFYLNYFDSDLISLAEAKAHRYSKLLFVDHAETTQWFYVYQEAEKQLSDIGVTIHPVRKSATDSDYHNALLRLQDPLWWRRQLRKSQARTIEHQHVRLGHVGRPSRQLYVSDDILKIRQSQRRRNEALLESIVAINNEGYEKDLLSLQKVSTSNPEIRRNELMARLKGLESYAKSKGLAADFYTLTAPSCYHRYRTVKQGGNAHSFFNSNFDGSSPRETQAYLNKQWAKIRAELHRQKLPLIGVRVAEPHHDGTPHWHILAFIDKKHRKAIRKVMRHYALEYFPDEAGAQKHRFTAKKIGTKTRSGKPSSAVGYVAKYISKNLSPVESIKDMKNDGQSVSTTVDRVEAWASVWGIRQFQQLGGERITIWRELRRIRGDESKDIPDQFKAIHHAADTGDYHDFIEQAEQIDKVEMLKSYSRMHTGYLVPIVDEETGEITHEYFDKSEHGKFNELKAIPVIGLKTGNHFLITRTKNWQLKSRKTKPPAAVRRQADSFSLGLVSLTVPIN